MKRRRTARREIGRQRGMWWTYARC
uniref:Uncharacterized protein n=1 Tax=Arundo donax TaxID=35708 RepID=A0A0A9AGR1_ARUDO